MEDNCHVVSVNKTVTQMDLVNPLMVRTIRPNINHRTVDNVRQAGLSIG